MVKGGKSEHERISNLEDQVGSLLLDVEALVAGADEIDPTKSVIVSAGPLSTSFFSLLPISQTALANFFGTGLVFAIQPLPSSIAMGSGSARCATTTPPAANTKVRVHNVTGNANLTLVVENTGRCADVTIKLMRPGAAGAVTEIGASPPAAQGNTTSVGPFAARRNDYVEVQCGTGGTGPTRCKFNYQVNQGP